MDKRLKKVEKAYRNKDFINSSDARVIRILAELLEPKQRFQKNNIKDMIVFFGSARTMPPDEAENYLKNIEEKIYTSDDSDKMHF
ncbi:MAG: lysine decarboxylase, partial [Candidatus Caldatribacteriota bacterium]